ncbi:DUF6281 family protein [Actinoplanes sp. NPDC051851]|uniref:DUF6281 family protein n=1 Tax=Actinoplanes sp. NPDC051851 TaxID=3154753 RepID=UPI0034277A0F
MKFLGVALILPVLAAGLVSGCSSEGEAESSCAAGYLFDGTFYREMDGSAGEDPDFVVGDRAGEAQQNVCQDVFVNGTPQSDGGDGGEAERIGAYRIEGVDTTVAIAVGESPEQAGVYAAFEGSEVPDAVAKLIDGE